MEDLEQALEQARVKVFGAQPLTTRCYLVDQNDDGTDGPGVPVVLRELDDDENYDILADVGKLTSDEEKMGGWTRETLARALVSFADLPFPADLEKRRRLIGKWPHGAIVALKTHWEEVFLPEIARAHRAIVTSPNPPGANAGPSFARKDAGQEGRSAA